MNMLFHPHLRRFVIVFFDDILIYSKSLEEHRSHLDIVFQCLISNQFFLKKSKCLFGQHSINYLGYIISRNGVGPNPEKIRAMQGWLTPSSLKQLRGFLGLTCFYRKFIRHYASITAPLTNLLKKDAFVWSNEAQLAFDELKIVMSQAPVLALPNFQEDFVLKTDASG
ncbi:uncharacterized protein LOC114165124 [Vigna unguiculata]|uniref:uncharacterized protein LOC114165124 n=1 Tax=Vigna unguiculata TaxID=3917 RepID=UPI001016E143|nr:uncharacterized protein LOC114165124 [Vigna unguiculata]